MRQISGTLVEVHGVGVLITGPAGAGKSDTALALIKAGQSLVADDAVMIVDQPAGVPLIGHAPRSAVGLLALRGIGLIDVRQHFGPQAVIDQASITLRIQLNDSCRQPAQVDEQWHDEAYHGISLPTLHLSQQRPLAALILVAAQEWRLGRPGIRAAKTLIKRHLACD